MARTAIVIAKRLNEAIRSKEMTHREAAKKMNVSDSALKKWLDGGGCTARYHVKVAKFLNTSVDDLVLRDEKPDSNQIQNQNDPVSRYKTSTISNLSRQIQQWYDEAKVWKMREQSLENKVELLREEIKYKERLIDEAGIVDKTIGT